MALTAWCPPTPSGLQCGTGESLIRAGSFGLEVRSKVSLVFSSFMWRRKLMNSLKRFDWCLFFQTMWGSFIQMDCLNIRIYPKNLQLCGNNIRSSHGKKKFISAYFFFVRQYFLAGRSYNYSLSLAWKIFNLNSYNTMKIWFMNDDTIYANAHLLR